MSLMSVSLSISNHVFMYVSHFLDLSLFVRVSVCRHEVFVVIVVVYFNAGLPILGHLCNYALVGKTHS